MIARISSSVLRLAGMMLPGTPLRMIWQHAIVVAAGCQERREIRAVQAAAVGAVARAHCSPNNDAALVD